MNEYGVDWPFWDENGLCREGMPNLSPKLVAEVLAWASDFTTSYDVEAGWPTEAAARSHERQGHRLLRLVAGELPTDDDVVLNLWETNRRKGF